VNDRDPDKDLSRLQQLLDLHGADLARFPEHERIAATALLAADPRAQRMVAEAVALANALAAIEAPQPSAALRRAVAEIPLRHPLGEDARAAFGWLPLRSAWALLASAALIMALGALTGAAVDGIDVGVAVQSAEPVGLTGDEDTLGDLTELAFASELDRELAP
jgi:hypothetical protein